MPRFEYSCKECDFKEFTSWTTKREELDVILKDKCPSCKGQLIQTFGTDSKFLPNSVIRTVSAKESTRREEKWHKKAEQIKHEDRVSQDAYYDMRD